MPINIIEAGVPIKDLLGTITSQEINKQTFNIWKRRRTPVHLGTISIPKQAICFNKKHGLILFLLTCHQIHTSA